MSTATLTLPARPVRARKRLSLSRALAVLAGGASVFTVTPWPGNGWPALSLEIFSVFALIFGVMLRMWSSLFISGRKEHELVTVGPYSVCRNPLYVGSFMGALGIALASHNMLLVAATLLAFLVIYPTVVRHEESLLAVRHGSHFDAYRSRVPRFVPKLSLYHEPDTYQFEPQRVRRAFRDALAFPLLYVVAKVISALAQSGGIPVLTL